MADLAEEFFYEGRLINFVQKLLLSSVKPRAISQIEIDLINNQRNLQTINQLLDNNLISNLNKYKKFIQPKQAVFFLLEALKINKVVDAKEIMDWAVNEQTTMTFEQLFESLTEFENVPVPFLPSLYGEYNESGRFKDEPTPTKNSSLNLEAMRNFK